MVTEILKKELLLCKNQKIFIGLFVFIDIIEAVIKMKIDFVAVDLDGTLLRTDHTVSQITADRFSAAAAQGVYIVPSTGRVRLPSVVSRLPGLRYAVLSNGAIVKDLQKDEVLYQDVLGSSLCTWLYGAVCQYDCFLEIYYQGSLLTDAHYLHNLSDGYGLSDQDLRIMQTRVLLADNLAQLVRQKDFTAEKFNLLFKRDADFDAAWAYFKQEPRIRISSGSKNALEINSATASKWSGILALCRILGVDPEHVMGIGDSNNDVEMLKNAAFSVAMKNADPQLFDFVDFVTDSNDEDGVAHAIEKFVLGL